MTDMPAVLWRIPGDNAVVPVIPRQQNLNTGTAF